MSRELISARYTLLNLRPCCCPWLPEALGFLVSLGLGLNHSLEQWSAGACGEGRLHGMAVAPKRPLSDSQIGACITSIIAIVVLAGPACAPGECEAQVWYDGLPNSSAAIPPLEIDPLPPALVEWAVLSTCDILSVADWSGIVLTRDSDDCTVRRGLTLLTDDAAGITIALAAFVGGICFWMVSLLFCEATPRLPRGVVGRDSGQAAAAVTSKAPLQAVPNASEIIDGLRSRLQSSPLLRMPWRRGGDLRASLPSAVPPGSNPGTGCSLTLPTGIASAGATTASPPSPLASVARRLAFQPATPQLPAGQAEGRSVACPNAPATSCSALSLLRRRGLLPPAGGATAPGAASADAAAAGSPSAGLASAHRVAHTALATARRRLDHLHATGEHALAVVVARSVLREWSPYCASHGPQMAAVMVRAARSLYRHAAALGASPAAARLGGFGASLSPASLRELCGLPAFAPAPASSQASAPAAAGQRGAVDAEDSTTWLCGQPPMPGLGSVRSGHGRRCLLAALEAVAAPAGTAAPAPATALRAGGTAGEEGGMPSEWAAEPLRGKSSAVGMPGDAATASQRWRQRRRSGLASMAGAVGEGAAPGLHVSLQWRACHPASVFASSALAGALCASDPTVALALPSWEPEPSLPTHAETITSLLTDCCATASDASVAPLARQAASLLCEAILVASAALAIRPGGADAHTWLAYSLNAALPLALLTRLRPARSKPPRDAAGRGGAGEPAGKGGSSDGEVAAGLGSGGSVWGNLAAAATTLSRAAAAAVSATASVPSGLANVSRALPSMDLGLLRAGAASRAASASRLHASCAVAIAPMAYRAMHLLGRAYIEAAQVPLSWRVAAWASRAPIPRPGLRDAQQMLLRAEHVWAMAHGGASWPANLLAQAQAHLASGDRAAAINCLALCVSAGSAPGASAESAEAAAEAATLRREDGLV